MTPSHSTRAIPRHLISILRRLIRDFYPLILSPLLTLLALQTQFYSILRLFLGWIESAERTRGVGLLSFDLEKRGEFVLWSSEGGA